MSPEHFTRFLDAVSDYLYEHGWYTQATYVMDRATPIEVEQYLFEHCYSRTEAREIVAKLTLETL